MSKSGSDIKTNEPEELKALYIIGPDIETIPEILKLYNRENCLVVGNGIDDVSIYDINKELRAKKLYIGSNTRIDISAHGQRYNKEHYISLDEEPIKTKNFLGQLQGLSPVSPLYVHLWSCYGGTANKDIKILNPGSIIVTHVKSQYISLEPTDNFSFLHSVTRYMNEQNLTPHLQYLFDQLENYQATTFNQKDSNSSIIKFKTIRTPQENSITNIISNALQKNITEEELKKELQNYLVFEGMRFYELFANHILLSDIGEFQKHVSNISNLEITNYITGVLLNVANLSLKDNIKDKEKTTNILNNIVDNIDTEIINHNILGISPLYIAVKSNNVELTKVLLDKGANPHGKYTEEDMCAPRKVRKNQLVRIQPMQSLTNSIEATIALQEVTNVMKPVEATY